VEFLGFQDNPYPWIDKARILIHSAKFEGLPTILIEGLMLNKLIVATDCPTGPKEILNEGKAGILVPVGNAEAMAEALNKLLTDEQLSATIINEVNMHSDTFSFKNTEKKFDNLITELLD
jgi:glycosyltransferase involved in cell wall biosynthesis